jgi:hypothetical protein
MSNIRIPETNSGGSLRGRRPAGKLRNRWEDKVLKDAAKSLNTKTLECSGKTQELMEEENKDAKGRKWAKES